MITVIGYGTFGKKVVNLIKNKEPITIIDIKIDDIDDLLKEGIKAIVGDATDENVLKKAEIDKADIVLILTNNPDINRKIAEKVCELSPKSYKIARAIPGYHELYMGLNIDKVINILESGAKDIAKEVEGAKLKRKLMRLKYLLLEGKKKCINEKENEEESKRPLLILTHTNPDPDAIASAMALKTISEKWGVEAEIAYGGSIGYDENKAMINLLGINLLNIENVNLNDYCIIAVVDTSTSKQLPILPPKIDIIIDHHNNSDLTAEYVDIRPKVGATSTILTQYLMELNIEPSRNLATALFYGIQSDTDYFKRETSKLDFEAAAYLQGYIDATLLNMIENPEISTEVMEVLARAIMNRKVVKGNIALAYVGEISNRDALPKAADFLLKMEGISTTFVFGIVGDEIHISARTKDLRLNLGEILNKAFGGGGHQTAAAAKIPLGIFKAVSDKEALRKLVEEAIRTKILEVIGIKEEEK
ncbi:Kef-type K+ transport systems (NAD-binding component fused to domain related to exopolyphosphatase) [Methanocaldococcus lauensis]|uniref:Kef-type K+ transport systems (NAD-binding component fused to domain related to exopolyphosphatase) n=1 Tax=Methanocaldococcus lauensis TaxID=2546128 RepID=A0A8D6PP50_9EURY|nr:DHH family phosphoesterase [Methanocaldococcus lauensis]CAB3287252.1 Kef-type K+ transport systems (NAD-binding component fused to domain related to exopolyphosphatase) [Methanocaldococcus lauensis]